MKEGKKKSVEQEFLAFREQISLGLSISESCLFYPISLWNCLILSRYSSRRVVSIR